MRHGWLDGSATYDEARELRSVHQAGGGSGRADRPSAAGMEELAATILPRLGPTLRRTARSGLLPREGRGGQDAYGRRTRSGRSIRPSRSGRDGIMADYHLEGPKPARIYEVILPKKLGYFGKIQEVLEDLFNEQAIRKVPFVQQSIARRHEQDAAFDEEAGSRRSARRRAATRSTRWTAAISRRRPGRRAGAGDPVHLP